MHCLEEVCLHASFALNTKPKQFPRSARISCISLLQTSVHVIPLWVLETQRWSRLWSIKSGKDGALSTETVTIRPWSKGHVGINKSSDENLYAHVPVNWSCSAPWNKKTGLFDQDGKRQISSQSKHCGGCVWDEVLLRLCKQNVVTLLYIPSGTAWNENWMVKRVWTDTSNEYRLQRFNKTRNNTF